MMKYSVYGIIAIEFLTDNDRNERGVKTIRHKVIGKITAATKKEAAENAENQISEFVDTNYPVRWKSEILGLKILEAQ